MKIAHAPVQVVRQPRAVAIGTFDGVHRGHRRVIEAAAATGLPVAVVTFDPHPRVALGNHVELISTLERRLELLAGLGVEETRVVAFTPETAALEPEEFVERELRPLNVSAVVAGPDFRFGRRRRGDLEFLRSLGIQTIVVEPEPGISSTAIRHALRDGDVNDAARLLGRPYELDGTVVAGDQRGGTLGFPTANLAIPAGVLAPKYGIYAGAALDHRAAVSVGTNPHYGGEERRIEPHLLDFNGDLYGRRLVVELWQRLRDERAFESEAALVEQIARDVEETRTATRPG